MFAKGQIIEIFFKLDEFWKKFTRFSPKSIEQTDRKKRHYHRDGKMSVPEIMLIMILFHSSGYRMSQAFLPQRSVWQYEGLELVRRRQPANS